MISGAERREKILARLRQGGKAVSATALAGEYQVSRQVIVQDVALLRASGHAITSTNRGYLMETAAAVSRVLKVHHTDAQLQEELELVVDMGGCVENVMVHHKVYGTLEAPLGIDSRRKVEAFLADIRSGKSSPLKNITADYHYHRILADSEETLDAIQQALQEKGFLVEPK